LPLLWPRELGIEAGIARRSEKLDVEVVIVLGIDHSQASTQNKVYVDRQLGNSGIHISTHSIRREVGRKY
jgi:hypothetical protein